MGAYVPVKLKRQVRDHFANCCAYCQTAEDLTVAIFEVEHIIPLVAGGKTEFSNLCLSCPTCNRYKAIHQTAVDPQTQELVPIFHPHQNGWSEHFAWSKDKTELLGLTPVGRATLSLLQINRPQLLRVRRMWVKLGMHPPTLE